MTDLYTSIDIYSDLILIGLIALITAGLVFFLKVNSTKFFIYVFCVVGFIFGIISDRISYLSVLTVLIFAINLVLDVMSRKREVDE